MAALASSQAHDWREGRRLRAWELKEQGWPQQRIAEALGVSESAVSQWRKRARTAGPEGLRHRPPPGAPPRLSPEQRARIPELLQRSPTRYGCQGEVWTGKRVAVLLWEEFGVRYHPAHLSRLVRAVGCRLRKPVRRASQRNEAAIAAWRAERWPALQSKP
jgi:transposase